MRHIRVLEKHLAELIAAGEVIERPASVVKELLENAIDAGATAVTVEIEKGGISYIRITDDGSGIPKDEVPTAFVRHATSKIQSQDDLSAIGTFGFRGEALASIAAMSKVELLTRTADSPIGCRYVIEGGDEVSFDDAGCPKGTTLLVRDIFYNVPARMKFLKKDVAEGNAVAAVVDRAALGNPGVSVRFIRDGKTILHTPGNGDLYATIYAVFGREVATGLIPVDYTMGDLAVKGFVSKPAFARSSRSLQYFFINSRFVKTRTAMAAVEEACRGVIVSGKFPCCVLDVTVPLNAVDVNVHPAKIEVRFVNERPIFDCVYAGVKSALESVREKKEFVLPEHKNRINLFDLAPQKETEQQQFDDLPHVLHSKHPNPEKTFETVSLRTPAKAEEKRDAVAVRPAPPTVEPIAPSPVTPDMRVTATKQEAEKPAVPKDSAVLTVQQKASSPLPDDVPMPPEQAVIDTVTPVQNEPKREPVPMKIVGEVFDTYIVAENGEDMVLIDKHAAHERLIYEKIKRENTDMARQMLLTPMILTMPKDSHAAVCDKLDVFIQAGFLIEDFGSFSIAVREIPVVLAEKDIEPVVMEIAESIIKNRNTATFDFLDRLYHSIACRSAIKAHDHSMQCELERLMEQLLAHPELRYCPHGRPIYIKITKRELEKQFGRIV